MNCILMFKSGGLNMSLRLFLLIETCLYLCVPDVDIHKHPFIVKEMSISYFIDLEMDSRNNVLSL